MTHMPTALLVTTAVAMPLPQHLLMASLAMFASLDIIAHLGLEHQYLVLMAHTPTLPRMHSVTFAQLASSALMGSHQCLVQLDSTVQKILALTGSHVCQELSVQMWDFPMCHNVKNAQVAITVITII